MAPGLGGTGPAFSPEWRLEAVGGEASSPDRLLPDPATPRSSPPDQWCPFQRESWWRWRPDGAGSGAHSTRSPSSSAGSPHGDRVHQRAPAVCFLNPPIGSEIPLPRSLRHERVCRCGNAAVSPPAQPFPRCRRWGPRPGAPCLESDLVPCPLSRAGCKAFPRPLSCPGLAWGSHRVRILTFLNLSNSQPTLRECGCLKLSHRASNLTPLTVKKRVCYLFVMMNTSFAGFILVTRNLV